MKERLQKILSRAGIASRREAEQMILDGRIMVNGATVAELGTKADPAIDAIRLDGRRLRTAEPAKVTLALHKPRGYVSTRKDPEGRPTVIDLLRGISARLYPIGRLDYNAEGLILLTNDGDLAYGLLRPGSAERVYRVRVKGDPPQELLDRLRHGVRIERRMTLPARIRRVSGGKNSWIEVGLHEGRKNQILLMFRSIGHPVIRLRRIRIGSIDLGSMAAGQFRHLTPHELSSLRSDSRISRRAEGGAGRPRSRARERGD